jgi:hypothetical protein
MAVFIAFQRGTPLIKNQYGEKPLYNLCIFIKKIAQMCVLTIWPQPHTALGAAAESPERSR